MKISWIRKDFDWMGKHSGYDLLFNSIQRSLSENTFIDIYQKPINRIQNWLLNPLYRTSRSNPMYASESTMAELKFLWNNQFQKSDLLHISYVENQLGLIAKWRKHFSGKIIGTAHQPEGWWKLAHNHPEVITTLDGLIVVGSSQVEYFEQFLPGKVFHIPHGVDTEFFTPPQDKFHQTPNRFLFSGKHLRDFETLASIIEEILSINPEIHFDILLPRRYRNWTNPTFISIGRHAQVHWYSNLSDLELRELYRNATALLLPMLDCTANNALLEGLSCGLPVISNDLTSLRSYTKDPFAHLFPVGDFKSMSEAVISMAGNPENIYGQRKAAREFVEKNFMWPDIAKQTLEVYKKILT